MSSSADLPIAGAGLRQRAKPAEGVASDEPEGQYGAGQDRDGGDELLDRRGGDHKPQKTFGRTPDGKGMGLVTRECESAPSPPASPETA
jgi:hypothetical protein